MYGVKDEACAAADSYAIAQVLKAGVLNIGDADLVICGEGSGDIYAQQVGPMLGALLGWPTVNAVNKVTAADGKVIVERGLENDVEVLEVALPAVISVTADINVPRNEGDPGFGKEACHDLESGRCGGQRGQRHRDCEHTGSRGDRTAADRAGGCL